MNIKHGVPASIIEKYSVYSKETASAMAHACKIAFDADIGIGITGTMGNIDPSTKSFSIPGEVFFSIEYNDLSFSYAFKLPVYENRLSYKLAVSELILNKVLEIIDK